jgi:hypothetical protein
MKDLFITYSNDNHSIVNGHVYEVIDMWYKLRKFKPKILLFDYNTYTNFRKIVSYKYNFNDDLLDIVMSNTYFYKIKKLNKFYNSIILSTDGKIDRNNLFITDIFIGFRCSNIAENFRKHILSKQKYLLYDYRIYDNGIDGFESIDYVKKIYFDIIKYKKEKNWNYNLLYLTKYTKEYDRYYEIENALIISDYLPNAIKPPVDNMFDLFSTYIYTPVKRKFDCSNRLIKECQYFGKKVDMSLVDYFDKALDIRLKDDLDSIDLEKDDFIEDFIKELIK